MLIRDPAKSLFSSHVIATLLICCLLTAIALQIAANRKTTQHEYKERVAPEDRFKHLLAESNREQILNNMRREGGLYPERNAPNPYSSTQQAKFSPYASYQQNLKTVVNRPEDISFGKRSYVEYGESIGKLRSGTPLFTPLTGGIPVGNTPRLNLLGESRNNPYSINPDIQTPGYVQQGDAPDFHESNSVALEQYERMGIRRKIPKWVENVRGWIAGTIIPLILKQHYDNFEELNKILSYYNRRLIFLKSEEAPISGSIKSIIWEELYELVTKDQMGNTGPFSMQQFGHLQTNIMIDPSFKKKIMELVKDRMNIEKYLRMEDFSVMKRDYVIERLNKLHSNFTGEYQNNTGSYFKGMQWTPELPRDSDVKFVINSA